MAYCWRFGTFGAMKRSLALLFLAFYLMGSTEIMELCKLPVLFHHYNEHKEKSKDLGFLDFLKAHYTEQTDQDADQNKDQQLPFKSPDINSLGSGFFLVEGETSIQAEPRMECNAQYSDYCNQPLYFGFLSSIWQPPKSC